MKLLDSGTNFARYALGDLVVVSLRDGYVDMPTSRLRQPGNKPFRPDLPPQVQLVDGMLRLSVNAFLVIEHDQHILIDTGAANSWEPTMGSLLQALEEAGVARGSIETVALTHTHEDHANGLVAADGTDAFPNLNRLLVPAEEVRMFDKVDRLSRFKSMRSPIRDGIKISAAVTAVQAHGHEVGHTAYEVSSGQDILLIWGDIIHEKSVQFERPELTWEYDANQNEARATRLRMLTRAAEPNVFVAGAHLPSPGIGKTTKEGGSFGFRPI